MDRILLNILRTAGIIQGRCPCGARWNAKKSSLSAPLGKEAGDFDPRKFLKDIIKDPGDDTVEKWSISLVCEKGCIREHEFFIEA